MLLNQVDAIGALQSVVAMVDSTRVHDIEPVIDSPAEVGESWLSGEEKAGGDSTTEYLGSSGDILCRVTLAACMNVPTKERKQ